MDFANTLFEVNANGEKTLMDVKTALYFKLFESALKGKVSQQRFLYKEIQKAEDQKYELIAEYNKLIIDWVIDNKDFGKPGYEIPFRVRMMIKKLEKALKRRSPDETSNLWPSDEE